MVRTSGQDRAALCYGASEQTLGKRRYAQRIDARRTCRLAGYRDVVRISAECRDVLMNPLQSGYLVQQTVVSRSPDRRLGCQLFICHIAEDAEPVCEINENNAFLRE